MTKNADTKNLVADRVCGECTECCKFIAIDDPALQKPTNLLCPHCVQDAGCSVYESRPQPCRGWYCCWRMLDFLSDDWRPDKSGIVIRPEGLSDGEITVVIVDENKKFYSEEFVSLVAAWIENGINILFERVGPVGFYPVKIPVNSHLIEPIKRRELTQILNQFKVILAHADTEWTWEADGLEFKSKLSYGSTS